MLVHCTVCVCTSLMHYSFFFFKHSSCLTRVGWLDKENAYHCYSVLPEVHWHYSSDDTLNCNVPPPLLQSAGILLPTSRTRSPANQIPWIPLLLLPCLHTNTSCKNHLPPLQSNMLVQAYWMYKTLALKTSSTPPSSLY